MLPDPLDANYWYVKHFIATLGPFQVDPKYFVTRHPLHVLTPFKPFSSLHWKYWLNYSTLYIFFTLTTIAIHIKLDNGLNTPDLLYALFSPWQSRWLGDKSNLRVISSFGFWTFNLLYGVDLWSTLTSQKFEGKVENWHDIDFFQTEFFNLHNSFRDPFLADNFLHYNLFPIFKRSIDEYDSSNFVPSFAALYFEQMEFMRQRWAQGDCKG